MSETPKLLMEKDGAIGWIIFNQPEKRNAVSLEMWELMPKYVEDLASDDAIRVVVLRGSGDQAFVAGADISQFKERRRNMADQEEYGRISARGQDSLKKLGKPLLAMIHGYCVGGGVSIAITCDMRLASDQARFGVPAARLGLGYHYDGMDKLMHLVGPAYVKEIFFTARTDFSAQDAWRMGLINQVVPKDPAGDLHPRLRADHGPQRAAHAEGGQGLGRPARETGGSAGHRHARQAHRRLLQRRGLPGGRAGVLREAPAPVQGALRTACESRASRPSPIEIPLTRNFGGSTYAVLKRCTVVTRLRTDAGLVSEVYNGDNREHGAEIVRLIREELAPRLKGQSIFEGERIWERAVRAVRTPAATARR